MCAIAGVLGLSCNFAIGDMLKTMQRRGPDGSGVYQSEGCCLLHSRLAIIDPDGGAQPMLLTWGRETYSIVYNGELYNTEEIRRELIHLGHIFRTHSDTEVILHAYAQWSEGCLEKFNGIFAFAVWEKQARKLFLARDRMGVKPLFYTLLGKGLIFASEIKTLLTYPGVKAQIDENGVAEILLMGPGRTPGCGVFHNICELEPGCCAYFIDGRFIWHRYWKLCDREHTDSFEDTAEKVKYLVSDAIRRQMVSDVPIGAFLSGGLDSSIICSVCAQEMQNDNAILDTFSVDYENNDKYFIPGKFQPNSDNAFISLMQREIGSCHHTTILTPENLLCVLEEATQARDLPGMADVDFSLLAFCGQIRKHVKVALSGECADEIFGGYPWFRDPEVRAVEGFPWAQNIKERSAFLSPYFAQKLDPIQYVQDRYAQSIAACDILPGVCGTERRMKEMVNLNQRWFMQTLLERKDRMSMYHGLEVRVPFCDHRIAEYLYGVPWEYKDFHGREKGLLRYAVANLLPEAVVSRKKSPYPKTYDPQYLKLVSRQLHMVLEDPSSPILQMVSADALKSLFTAQPTWPWYGQLMKIPQTMAYMLQINVWLKAYQIEVI